MNREDQSVTILPRFRQENTGPSLDVVDMVELLQLLQKNKQQDIGDNDTYIDGVKVIF
jgi:hypothetical protein